MRLERIGRAENLVLWGPSRAGKSHLCEGLAHAVIGSGRRLTWFSLESLTAPVSRAKVDASVQKVVAHICRADPIVIDDIGTGRVPRQSSDCWTARSIARLSGLLVV
jgi:DNA replication protein DnaC